MAQSLGWPTGLEPATSRATVWRSTLELRPPSALFYHTPASPEKVVRDALPFPQEDAGVVP